MKKIYVYGALCAALIATTSCGGNEQPAVVEPVEEATAWSDVNSFDTNGAATGSEVTNFGQNGQIVSVDKFNVDKDSKESVKTDHVIYQNGKPAYTNNLKADGTVEGHEVYTYDEKGNLTEHVLETYSEGLKRIAPASRYVYTYDANGDITSVKEQKVNPKGWSTAYEWTYGYDAQGRVNSRMDYTGDGNDRKQSCQYTWKYEDGSNKIAQLDYFFYDLKTSRLRHDSKTRYTYNAAGQVKEAIVIRHKSNQKRDDINSRRFTYSYNAAGQMTRVLEEKWNSGSSEWYEVTNTAMSYDDKGQLVEQILTKFTNKGLRQVREAHAQGAPAEKPNVAPATPAFVVKPVLDLEDKHLTSKEEE